jgi:hypothetical protein
MLFGLDVMLRLAAGRTAAPAAAMGDSRSRPSTPASGTRAGDDGANQKHTMSPHKRDATQHTKARRAILAQRKNASRAPAARRYTPPRPSSRISMIWNCLRTS